MLVWIKKFFTDETAFVGYTRAGMVAIGGSIVGGYLDVASYGLPKWTGIALMATAGFLRAGEKNKEV